LNADSASRLPCRGTGFFKAVYAHLHAHRTRGYPLHIPKQYLSACTNINKSFNAGSGYNNNNIPGKLSDEELDEMKKHSEYGYYIVQYMEGIDRRVQEAILYHHEREDGSGYPIGLKGEQIPLFAKVLAIADTFDAMTADRAYKMKNTPFEVFQLMQNDCFGYLDTIILNTFLSNISHYYIGSKVRLNDGRIAEIVYINSQQYGKPVIKIGDEYIDLMAAKGLKIEELI
jgi:hypothetical protein